MKKQSKLLLLAVLGFASLSLTSCDKDDETPREGISRAQLIFTELEADPAVYPHGDHFHGLGSATETDKVKIVQFNENGEATQGGHLHLEAEAIYKLEFKAWDYANREVQNDFIADKATADQYKAFLIGGNLVLNSATGDDNDGAIFQPRELTHGDGTDVTGSGGTGTVGIVSYFIIGHENHDLNDDVTFVLRKLNADVKPTITRNDWNDAGYASKFSGEDVLKLKFEIHAEHGH